MADDPRERHDDVFLAGLRGRGAAVGLAQLVIELQRAGVLDSPSVDRIREAVLQELTLPGAGNAISQEVRDSVREHLERLLPRDPDGDAPRS